MGPANTGATRSRPRQGDEFGARAARGVIAAVEIALDIAPRHFVVGLFDRLGAFPALVLQPVAQGLQPGSGDGVPSPVVRVLV